MDESIVKHLDTKVMKLSEAIRIGAKIRPQCRSRAFMNGGSCAIGAAYEGLYGKPWPEEDWETFPWMSTLAMRFPKVSICEIMDRNDRGESRESIADWLEAQGY